MLSQRKTYITESIEESEQSMELKVLWWVKVEQVKQTVKGTQEKKCNYLKKDLLANFIVIWRTMSHKGKWRLNIKSYNKSRKSRKCLSLDLREKIVALDQANLSVQTNLTLPLHKVVSHMERNHKNNLILRHHLSCHRLKRKIKRLHGKASLCWLDNRWSKTSKMIGK